LGVGKGKPFSKPERGGGEVGNQKGSEGGASQGKENFSAGLRKGGRKPNGEREMAYLQMCCECHSAKGEKSIFLAGELWGGEGPIKAGTG